MGGGGCVVQRIRDRVHGPVGINLAEPLGRHRAVNIPPDLKVKDFPLHHIAVRVFNLKDILQNRRLIRQAQRPVGIGRGYPLHIAELYSLSQQLNSNPFPRPHLAVPVFSLDKVLVDGGVLPLGFRA